MQMRTPLGRVRGLGTAKEGVEHWWMQRLTSVALVPLVIWFVFQVPHLAGADLIDLKFWLGHHVNALLMVLLVVTLFHHAQLGMQVVIEDYVHHEGVKLGAIVAVKFLAIVCALSSVLAVLRLAFSV
jgi:succinate dehydrogenase / fumarate reductase membrane anchor subunit